MGDLGKVVHIGLLRIALPALPGVPLGCEVTAEALETVLQVMRTGETDAIRLAAANVILDRAYGRPQAAVVVKDGREDETEDYARRSQAAVLGILEARYKAIDAGLPDPTADWDC